MERTRRTARGCAGGDAVSAAPDDASTSAPQAAGGSAVTRRVATAHLVGLLAVACLPLLSMLVDGAGMLADPHSEIPVRLWIFDTFPQFGLLGGTPPVNWPRPGPLNNADLFGSIVFPAVRPLLGDYGAWNLLVVGSLWANMAATWRLVARWLGDAWAATLAAIGIGFAPLVVTYCVNGAVLDMLHLWPWILALHALCQSASWLNIHDGVNKRAVVVQGAMAGGWSALGLALCPYHAPIFLTGMVPFAGAWAWAHRQDRAALARAARGVGAALVTGVLLAAPYALALRSITAAPDSQMSAEFVASTRNAPPWNTLRPGYPSHYHAELSELVASGPEGLRTRDVGSRYTRTIALSWILLLLALASLFRQPWERTARPTGGLLAIGALGALAATGPFLCLTEEAYLVVPWNPAFLAVHYGIPGANLILETYRFALVTAVVVPLTAAVMYAELRRTRWERWRALLPLALLVELAVRSPIPIPFPVTRPVIPEAYARLDEVLPPGPILELPWFDAGTGRFARAHFLHQRVHKRPIADTVRGVPPDFLLHNPFTNNLLALEASDAFRFEPRPIEREPAGRRALSAAGFVGIVVDPAAYRNPIAFGAVRERLGPGAVLVGDRWVWRLD